MITHKLFIDGDWRETAKTVPVINPFDGSTVANIHEADTADTQKAIDAAYNAKKVMASLTNRQRGDILDKVAGFLTRDREEIAATITAESGKGLMFSRGEVDRTVENFGFAADEARRLSGELIPFGAAESGKNHFGWFKRYPIGVVGAITPFNFPLNLVAHKVGPAIAAGNPIILKPASATPLTAVKLVELLLEAGLPKQGINLIVGPGSKVGNAMVESDKINMITFTGSPPVGLDIKSRAGIKKVTLELGSNSAVIVNHDGDVDAAMPKCVVGAFANSGQVCISIQRIYVHEDAYDEFVTKYTAAVNASKTGDPADEKTLVGPMINEKEAERAEAWVNEAVKAGARILTGGKRKGTLLEPTVLTDTDESMTVVSDEVFGPVVSIMKVQNVEEAIRRVNDSQFGLQASIYTKDINTALTAADEIECGGVMINDMPTFRVDQMPYGGMKLSGTGREGPRFAVEEMTELKTVAINRS